MKEKQLRLKRVRWIVCFLTCVVMLLILPSIEVRAESKPNYLTFTAEEDGSTIRFYYESGTNIQYSIDGGVTWSDYKKGKELKLEKTGDKVSFKGKKVTTGKWKSFSMTGRIAASGSVTSLTDENGGDPNVALTTMCYSYMFYQCESLVSPPELPATTLASSCYYNMFSECTNLTSAPILPATTLADYCYRNMFYGCKALTRAPELPVTTLEESCYDGMFWACESLTSAPVLPATTMASSCYDCMFADCIGLTSAPELPGTILAKSCYHDMFWGCKNLVRAPKLPATTLADWCYIAMFGGCTSLEKAPELPATTLASDCYYYMFEGCTSLKKAPELPATTLAYECYKGMFSGCTSLTSAPKLPATTLAEECYARMFSGCTNLTSAPKLPATILADSCYKEMFYGCDKLDISTKKEGGQEWSLPTPNSESGSTTQNWNADMFIECPKVDFDGLGSKEPQFGVTYYQIIPKSSEEEQESNQKPENAPDDTQENKPENTPDDIQDNKPGNTPDNSQGNTSELAPGNTNNEKDYRFTIPVAQAGTKVAAYQGCNFYEDSNGNKRCYDDSGVPIINEFKCDGTYTYYFQLDGTCMKSRLSYHPDGEHVIYLDENGHEVFSNFANVKQTIEGNAVDDFCFFDVHGYLYVDVVTFNQTGTKLYYANQYGVMERSKWFEFSDTCKWADGNPFDKAGGKYGYAMEDGSLMTNTATYDWEGRLCYLQGNGVAKY